MAWDCDNLFGKTAKSARGFIEADGTVRGGQHFSFQQDPRVRVQAYISSASSQRHVHSSLWVCFHILSPVSIVQLVLRNWTRPRLVRMCLPTMSVVFTYYVREEQEDFTSSVPWEPIPSNRTICLGF
jgi:hypothetical protein